MKSWTVALADLAASIGLSGYRLAGAALSPFMPIFLGRRAARGKEDRGRLGERFGRASVARPPGRLIWVHAASVGETNAVLPLIARLGESGFALVLTTGTVTSAEIAEARLPNGVCHQFAPLDIKSHVERFLDHWRPELALFVESELWPVMITRLARRAVPQIVVNARLSVRSFRAWSRVPWLAAPLFGHIDLCLAQSRQDADRLAGLGMRNVTVAGNLKWDAPTLDADPTELERLRTAVGRRPVWVAASTHDGEESQVADAHQRMRAERPSLLTVIVPRHPARGDAIRAMLVADGLTVARRSLGEGIEAATDIYLADTLGELGLFFRLAPIAFLGNSLAARGGHNPIEPLSLHAAVLHGPHVHNFSEVYACLDQAVPAGLVEDAENLAAAVLAWLDDPAAAAAAADNGMRALVPLTGALEATVDALRPYLAGNRAGRP